jgi:hypothetical protein
MTGITRPVACWNVFRFQHLSFVARSVCSLQQMRERSNDALTGV